MEKKQLTLEESKNKIKFMMNYDSKKTLTEQIIPSNPNWMGPTTQATGAPGTTGGNASWASEVGEPYINSMVRRLKRNYARIDSIIKALQGQTYQGKPALDGVKIAYKTATGKDLPNVPASETQPQVNTAASTTPQESYRPSQGTDEDPYVPGTIGDGIGKVQQYLGGLKVDSMFGPKTQSKLAEKVPQFKDKFTNNDLITIYKTLYPQPSAQKISGVNTIPNLAPQINTTQLAGQPTTPNYTD